MRKPGPKPVKVKNNLLNDTLKLIEQYKSASEIARILDVNRHTIEKIYQEYADKEIEETDKNFINRQRLTKRLILGKLDKIIQITEDDLKDIDAAIVDTTMTTNYDSTKLDWVKAKQIQLSKLSDLIEQKGSLELTPTLDIAIAAAIETKYGTMEGKQSITTKSTTPTKT